MLAVDVDLRSTSPLVAVTVVVEPSMNATKLLRVSLNPTAAPIAALFDAAIEPASAKMPVCASECREPLDDDGLSVIAVSSRAFASELASRMRFGLLASAMT